ncbi:hypothetical protein QTP81_06825 [Alteromonas sp. ASW11-36]|uniref:Uncharacterized protein n=1 Tax=Alteromonas arenosi TaxID=3055817 RepID=A0ABT7SVT3_9ALTE|nr:hypothetical protein [Alteromonas sp. ASW11-36]MDM7860304.1 hypothetical protein [Alteromonas sp. ASW11-36]
MKKLVLIPLLCALSADALADRCDKYAAELAADYKSDIQALQDDFDQSLASHKRKYLKYQVDPEFTFEMVADVWKSQFDYDTHYQRFTHEILAVATNLNTDPKTQKYCKDQDTIENWLERRVDTYEKLLGRLEERIDARVELETVDDTQGLTIVSAYSYGVAPKISIVGEGVLSSFKIGPLVYDQHFEVRALDKGTYRWDRVELGFNGFALQDSNIDVAGSTSYTFYDFTDDAMVFTVTPKRLNFAGVFIFESTNHGARADLHDRSAISIKLLEEQYPYLLHRYEWHNALMPSDPFLSHYYQQRYHQEAE